MNVASILRAVGEVAGPAANAVETLTGKVGAPAAQPPALNEEDEAKRRELIVHLGDRYAATMAVASSLSRTAVAPRHILRARTAAATALMALMSEDGHATPGLLADCYKQVDEQIAAGQAIFKGR